MALAVEPPVRLDLSCRTNADKRVPVRYWHSSENTADDPQPIPITSAWLTMTFDLPDDATWPSDPDTGEPIPPTQQTHVIDSTTPGDPDGWIIADRYDQGEVIAYIAHGVWAQFTPPHTGMWDLVAVTTDSVQECLVGGRFIAQEGA